MEYSVVIPLFNEEESLPWLGQELGRVMALLGAEYEIIYVNDGSTDNSGKVLEEMKMNPAVRIVSLKTNQGQSAALHAGFKHARGQWIITLDADGQNPPQEIMPLLRARDEVDFITGVRKVRRDSLARKLSSQTAKFLRRLVLGDTTRDTGCSLRVFRREITDNLPFFKNFHRFFPFLVKKRGFTIKEVYVQHNPRRFGRSKYGTFKRAGEGIFDLWGVFWLKKRLLNYEVKSR